MTWAVNFTDSFTRSNASSLGNGWLDANTQASIASNQASFVNNTSSPQFSGLVLRPTSENTLDQRTVLTILPNGLVGSGRFVGLPFRVQSAGNEYVVGYDTSSNALKIYKAISAALTSLAATTASASFNVAQGYSIDAQVVGINPTVISATLTNTTTSTVVATVTFSDSTASLQAVGQSGMYMYGGPGNYNSFTSYNDLGVVAGTASTTASGNTTASVTVGAAAGGTAPYTYQWYRSTTSGFTPGSGNILSGATSLTLNDTGLTNGTTYYYVNVATDSASNTGNSNQTSATPSSTMIAGTASVTSTGNGIATVTVTNPSGGTSPYSYQWYRSTTSGFTPGSGNLVSGATSQTLNDAGLTNGTTYYYVNVVGDSASHVATSNQIAATPASPNILGVASPALIFSPGNWKGDTGRGGTVYRQTWNNGAYLRARWTAASSGATATLLIPSTSTTAAVSYFINGKLQASTVAATGNISLSGIVAGAVNDLLVVFEVSAQTSRWGGTNVLQIQGIQLDGGSTAGAAPTMANWVLFIGDSITEGVYANNGVNNALYAYSFAVGQALLNAGYDYCISACAGSGYIKTGDSGDVPAYYAVSGGVYSESTSRWDKLDSGVSLLDGNGQISAYGSTGTAPAAIYINYGTNETVNALSLTDLQTSVTQVIPALQGAAPNAKIIVGIPWSMYYTTNYPTGPSYIAAIKAGVTANSSDAKLSLGDCGATLSYRLSASGNTYSGGVHPEMPGTFYITPYVSGQIMGALGGGSAAKTTAYSFVS